MVAEDVNSAATEIPSWVQPLFERIDAMDPNGFGAFLMENASFKFGNAEPVIGKAVILEVLTKFFGSIKAIRHEVPETWVNPGVVICRGEVTYTRHDSTKLTVPFADIFKMDGDLIKEYLIYIDISQLYASDS